MCQSSLVTLLLGLAATIIAFWGGYIAWQQWRTSRNTLKLALFDRRVVIYEGVVSVIRSLLQAGRSSDALELQFLDSIKSARWLFDGDIDSFLRKDLWGVLVDFGAYEKELDGRLGPGERSKLIREQRERKEWLMGQLTELENRFDRFLAVGH